MAFGMFCAIPLPKIWDESCADRVLPNMPIVGVLIGAIWWGAAELLSFVGVHAVLAAAIIMLVPFVVAGFIHLDGYMDTSDAILSRRSNDERVRILKDPHTGAFAVIMVSILFVLQFAAAYAVFDGGRHLALLVVIPVISRCGSALAVFCLKTAPYSGYAAMFRRGAGATHRIVVVFFTACILAAAWLIAGASGLIVAGAAALAYVVAMAIAYRCLGGVSGDLTGFSLVVCELCGIVALGTF
jgi:adenosylcobinamide-GDP ribazoletransferase